MNLQFQLRLYTVRGKNGTRVGTLGATAVLKCGTRSSQTEGDRSFDPASDPRPTTVQSTRSTNQVDINSRPRKPPSRPKHLRSRTGRYADIGCKLKQNANDGCNSCAASLAGLVLSFIASFISLVIATLIHVLGRWRPISRLCPAGSSVAVDQDANR